MRTALLASLTAVLLAVAGSSVSAAAEESNPWLGQRVMNMAHSGGEDEAPMNTLYAFDRAKAVGADMLEIDVQLTKDGDLAVIHDGTVDETTDATGRVDGLTMAELRELDAAHWFVPGRSTVHDDPDAEYPLRGARHGDVEVEGASPEDFGVPSLSDVLERFPDTPTNIEIKGSGTDASYLRTAEVLAEQIGESDRTDLIVGSFSDEALESFHELAPDIAMSAGQDAMIGYFLSGTPLPEGVVALQVPITYQGIPVVSRSFVDRAHRDGYAVHAWFSGSAPDDAETYEKVVETCVDGLMPAKPSVLEEVLTQGSIERPSPGGTDPRPACALEDEDPADPGEPTDPEDPTEPGEPEDPTTPTRPTEPEDPTGPGGPTGPSDPEQGTRPQPAEPGAEDRGTDETESAASSEPPAATRAPERPRVVQTDGWVRTAPAAP